MRLSVTVTGAARRDLTAEQGHHGAVGAKHIAEAHRGEGGGRAAGHGLHHHFAQALAGAHDGGGVDGLIRRDQDEFFDAVSVRRPDGVQRAEHVVADGLLGTGFHQRDMLMGGGVEHHVGLVGIKQQFQPPGSRTEPISTLRGSSLPYWYSSSCWMS